MKGSSAARVAGRGCGVRLASVVAAMKDRQFARPLKRGCRFSVHATRSPMKGPSIWSAAARSRSHATYRPPPRRNEGASNCSPAEVTPGEPTSKARETTLRAVPRGARFRSLDSVVKDHSPLAGVGFRAVPGNSNTGAPLVRSQDRRAGSR